MSKKTILLIALLMLSPIVIYLLWPSDENRIRKLFREGAAAIGAEKLDDAMSKVSLSYTDEHGLTYILIRDVMKKFFQDFDRISVEYDIRDLRINGEAAAVDLDVRVVAAHGKEYGYVLADAERPVRMTFTLEKVRMKWLVAKVEGLKPGM